MTKNNKERIKAFFYSAGHAVLWAVIWNLITMLFQMMGWMKR